jgi:hypothetical protein
MELILRRLEEIDSTLAAPSDHFRGELLAERDDLIDRLGDSYLTATPRQRAAVRRSVGGRRRLVMAFEDRVAWHAYRFKGVEDVRHLRLGLAAASIVGSGVDFRDFRFGLNHLSRAALRAGIDPRPYFREVANLSGKGRFFLRLWS